MRSIFIVPSGFVAPVYTNIYKDNANRMQNIKLA